MESDDSQFTEYCKGISERRCAIMRYTKEKMSEMTRKKQNSPRSVDRLAMDELLEMGFSYNSIGTHYLHDSIVLSTQMNLEDFTKVSNFCQSIGARVCKKYSVGAYQYANNIESAIERAFETGNINYLLDTFRSSYDKDKMKVNKNVFIMTVRRKIMEALEAQESHNATQLRLIIQGSVEEITDCALLKGICDIVISLSNREMA